MIVSGRKVGVGDEVRVHPRPLDCARRDKGASVPLHCAQRPPFAHTLLYSAKRLHSTGQINQPMYKLYSLHCYYGKDGRSVPWNIPRNKLVIWPQCTFKFLPDNGGKKQGLICHKSSKIISKPSSSYIRLLHMR